MTTYNQVYAIAKSHLDHGGSHARDYCGLSKSAPYCCAFVTMCMQQSGGANLFYGGKKVTYCPTAMKWCQSMLAEIPFYLAMPMDIIFFDWQPNGTPDHIGFVLHKIAADKIKTLEGNTSGGIVAIKSRSGYVQGIFRPHYVPNVKLEKAKLTVDGDFGYKSIYMLQLALGIEANGILDKATVKALQKKVGASPDGSWGPKTSCKVQAWIGATQDSKFYKKSVEALQKKINAICYPVSKTKKTASVKKKTVSKPKAPVKPVKLTNAQKIVAKATELAWGYGTAKKKRNYKTGAPRDVMKAALKRYGWADNKAEMSDCGNNVSAIVRESGVDKSFKALHGVKTPFPKTEKAFNIVLKGKKIPKGFLKPGDIIRYKKKNGKQHVLIDMGDGKICEASHYNRFCVILKDTKKYNKVSKVKTIQVLRAKEG